MLQHQVTILFYEISTVALKLLKLLAMVDPKTYIEYKYPNNNNKPSAIPHKLSLKKVGCSRLLQIAKHQILYTYADIKREVTLTKRVHCSPSLLFPLEK